MTRVVTIGSNEELYSSIRELSARLRELGALGLADDLLGALVCSTVPSEMLAEVRASLHRLREHGTYLLPDVRLSVNEALAALDEALATVFGDAHSKNQFS